jgi:hypothetical protein
MSERYMKLCNSMYGLHTIIELLNPYLPDAVYNIVKQYRGLDVHTFINEHHGSVQRRTMANQSIFNNVDTTACLCNMQKKHKFLDNDDDYECSYGWYVIVDKDFEPTDKFQARINTCGCKGTKYKVDNTLRRCLVNKCQCPTSIASPNRFCKGCECMFSGLNGFDAYPEYVMAYTRLRKIWLNHKQGKRGVALFMKACVYALAKYVESSDDFDNDDSIQTKNILVMKNIWYLEKMVAHLTDGEYKVNYVVYKLHEYIEWIRKSSFCGTFDVVKFIRYEYYQR